MCVYAWYNMQTQKLPLGLLPLRLLRWLVKLYLSGAFILVAKLFASSFVCQVNSPTYPEAITRSCFAVPHVLYLGVALLMLLFFLPLCAVLALVYHDSNPRSIDPEARVHGRGELLYLAVRTIGVFFNFFLPSEPLINFTLFLLTGAAAAYFILVQPFYERRANEFRASLLVAACVFALGSFALGFVGAQGDASKVAASVFFLLLVAGSFPLGVYATRLRLRLLYKRHRPSMETHLDPAGAEDEETRVFLMDTDVELATRFLVTGSLKNAPSALEVEEATEIFERGLLQFPSSAFVRLAYAKFLATHAESHGAMPLIKSAWKCKPKFDFRYFLLALRRESEQKAHADGVGGADGMSYVQLLEFRGFYSKAQAAHQKTLQLLGQFWTSLRRANFDAPGAADDVRQKLEQIGEQKDAAQAAYTSLLEKYGTSKVLLRSYGKFCEDVLVDPEAASTFYRKADEIEHKQMLDARAKNRVGGALGPDGSASESESSKHSSSQGSATGVVRRRRRVTFRLAQKETNSVKKLSWGILGGMLTLVVIGAVLFAVSKLLNTDFSNRVAHSRVISMEAAYLADVLFSGRSLALAAQNMTGAPGVDSQADAGNRTIYEHHVDQMTKAINEFEHPFIGLWIFAYYPSDIPVVSDAVINDQWTKVLVNHYKVTQARPLEVKFTKHALYDAINLFIKHARDFAHGGIEQAADPVNNVAFRSMMINAIKVLLPRLTDISHLVADRLKEVNSSNRGIAGILFAINVGFVIALCLAVFEPAFRSVAKNQRGVQDILSSIPRRIFKERAKHYSKARAAAADADEHELEDEGGHEHEPEADGEEEDGAPGAGVDAEDDDDPAQRADDEDDAVERLSARGAESDDGGEEGADADGDADADPKRKGRAGASAVRSDLFEGMSPASSSSDLRGSAGPDPKAPRSGLALEVEVAAARSSATLALSGPSSPGGSERAQPQPPAPAPLVLSLAQLSGAAGAVDPHSRSGRSATIDAIVDGAKFAPQPAADGAGSALGAGEGRGAGRRGGSKSPTGEELETDRVLLAAQARRLPVLPAARGAARASRSTAALRRAPRSSVHHVASDEVLAEREQGKPKPKAARAGKPKGGKGRRGEEKPVFLQLSKARGDSDSSDGGGGGGGARGRGKRAPKAAAKYAAGRSPPGSLAGILKAKPARADHEGEREREGRHGEGASEDEGRPREAKKAASAADAKKAAGAAEGAESSGNSVIGKLRKRYITAFFIIVCVSAANFASSFYFMTAVEAFGSDVLYATERRQIARTSIFYAREAFVNDGTLVETREEILQYLSDAIERLEILDFGLKHGNASLGLMGADNRFLPQDKLNYYPICSIRPARYGEENGMDIRDASFGGPCPFSDPRDIDFYGRGMFAMMQVFLDWLGNVRDDRACPGEVRCYKVGWKARVDESSELQDCQTVWHKHLRPALEQSIDLFFKETNAQLDLVGMVQGILFAFNVSFLVAMYVFLFRPMVRKLQSESNRTVQLLQLIPRSVVADVRYLQRFYDRVEEGDDAAPRA
eukprot:tig00021168_g19098.t2